MAPEPYVTADDVAAHLKITRRQVLEMTRRGLIPARALGVGEYRSVWRYKISEVENAIASGIGKRPPHLRTKGWLVAPPTVQWPSAVPVAKGGNSNG